MGTAKCGEESSCEFTGDDFHILMAHRLFSFLADVKVRPGHAGWITCT